MNAFTRLLASSLFLSLAACGGGGDDSGDPPSTPPPSSFSYATPQTYTKGTAIAALNPTVNGSPTSFSVAPALPAGLTLNAANGSITGTPTALQAATAYTVTATNSGGSAIAGISIAVNDVVPSITYPAAAYTFTTGAAISAVTPTATGGPVVTWSISGTLPAGLTFNNTNGQITGTPTAVIAASTHTVTATNSGGNSTAGISITVNDVVPSITYPRAAYTFATGAEIIGVEPAVTGGAVVTWSISGTLPAGVNFNTANGHITGTPTAVVAPSNHVVTATNSGGSDTFDVAIGVRNGTLFELGHATAITSITYAGSRILSIDDSRRVRLFDAQTASIVAASEPTCDATCGDLANLAGSTFVVRRMTGYDIYNAQTGALLRQIASPALAGTRWKLSTDGTYLVAWNATGLTAWSTGGANLVTRAGTYSNAGVFAAPAEIRVGNGGAGAQVIEYIAMPSGASTLSAQIVGTFHSWFGDGERFISKAAGTTVVIYSRTAVQQDTKTLSATANLAGQGNWFWNSGGGLAGNDLEIYAVGASTSPSATFYVGSSKMIPSANTIGILAGLTPLTVIDLSHATPTSVDYDTPMDGSYAARSPADFVAANSKGVMLGAMTTPQPIRYSIGYVRAVAGSSTRAAVTTASGEVLYFDMATGALEGEIPFSGWQVALSVNGNVLGVMSDGTYSCSCDYVLRLYSLPSKNVLAEWPVVNVDGSRLQSFVLSDGGDLVGLVSRQAAPNGSTVTRQLVRYDNSVMWTDTLPNENGPITFHLSPSGQLVGAPSQYTPSLDAGTNIYTNATLTGAPNGLSAGWVDNNRLLVATFRDSGTLNHLPVFDGTKIVNPAGQTLATVALPLHKVGKGILPFQRVTADSIYVPELNTIMDVNSGDTLWTSTTEMQWPISGAVAGDYVVFGSGSTIRAEPR